MGHGAPAPLGRETAALLACAEGTVLSHRSAALLWGLAAGEGLVEVTICGRQTAQPRGSAFTAPGIFTPGSSGFSIVYP